MTAKSIALFSLFVALVVAGCVVVSEKPADTAPPPPATAATATATDTVATAGTTPAGPALRSPPRAADAGATD